MSSVDGEAVCLSFSRYTAGFPRGSKPILRGSSIINTIQLPFASRLSKKESMKLFLS